MNIKPILGQAKKTPIVIAGPCSAETEEQVLATAHGLKMQVSIYSEQASGNPELDQVLSKV